MAGFAAPVTGLSSSIVNRVYDPQVRYQPNLHLQPHEEDGALSTQPYKSNKVWKQQRALYYNENPRERVQEKVLAKVTGKDGREQIVETTKWPYSMFAQITMKFKGQTYGGSGALVGPHHILTCGHNVYDADENVWAEEITVYPALNDKHAPFGSVKVVKVFTFIQYTNQKDERYDIALLILNKSIGKYTGWAGMLSAPDDQLSQEKVNIVGYPGDKGMTQMWGMKHKIHQIKPEQFEYHIDTNGGQSGSAIWISKFGAIMILGVHTTGGNYTNTGARLSKEKFEALIQKIAESYERVKPQGIVPQPVIQVPFVPKQPQANAFQPVAKQPSPQPAPAPTPLVFQPSLQPALPPIAFGAAKWAAYFGNVGIEPPLPPDIYQILNAPCPLWPWKKIHETHLLTLIPQTINGQPLTLETLGQLVQKPLQGPATKYNYLNLGEYQDPPNPVAHWTLMSRDVIHGHRSRYAAKAELAQQYPGYEIPHILDATVSIFMEHVQSGTRLYSDNTYTWCQEKYDATGHLAVGGFAAGGLDVYSVSYGKHVISGVGLSRKPQPNPFQPVAPVQAIKAPALPAWVFGAAEWNKYFGDVGVEPPLPNDIVQRLPELSANNVLVLIPATVNGQPLTLKTLGELVQKPRNGGKATNYNYFNLGEYYDRPAPKSHWALLTRTVIGGSREKPLRDEQVVLDRYSQETKILYEVPTILDATVCNFMEYVRFGTWLYTEQTYTWCQEKYSANYNLLVGGGDKYGCLGVRHGFTLCCPPSIGPLGVSGSSLIAHKSTVFFSPS